MVDGQAYKSFTIHDCDSAINTFSPLTYELNAIGSARATAFYKTFALTALCPGISQKCQQAFSVLTSSCTWQTRSVVGEILTTSDRDHRN